MPRATFRHHLAAARGVVIERVRLLLEQHRRELRVTELDLAAFLVVSAAEGVGCNATRDVFDERLAAELSTLFRLYLTGAGAPARSEVQVQVSLRPGGQRVRDPVRAESLHGPLGRP